MVAMVWINGSLRSAEEVGLSPFDHGITVGNGVFETLLASSGKPFAFTRHYRRLQRSAAAMGLSVRSAEELWSASLEVLQANELAGCRARLRITVTGGPAPLGSERGEEGETTLVAASPTAEWGETEDVSIVPYTRNENGALAGVKTTSYGENVVAQAGRKGKGAGGAKIYKTKGEHF
ncbi:MAG: aminotransferase class IV, partial [Roseibacillus sp.]|nr:aminotransferase class IV [Roseibacillus sp.]